jgi:uncharacterized protein (TIGR03382 family)
MKKLGLVVVVAFAALARADWPSDAGEDVPVANVDHAGVPNLVNDGQSGVFVIFVHYDGGAETLRAEHFNALGDRLWAPTMVDGGYVGQDLLGLSLGAVNQGQALAVTDDDGGFVAAYATGVGPYTLSVQRFDGNGTPLWAPTGTFGGVQLLANPLVYDRFSLAPDRLNGALVTLETSNDVTGQRIDSTGAQTYGTGFSFVGGQLPGPFYSSQFLSPDGLGGMYFIWPTSGSESISPSLDHVSPTGSLLFSVPSVAPQLSNFEDWSIFGLSAGAGVWASWYQPGASGAVYLQLFLADGGAAFTDAGPADGLLVAPSSAFNANPTLVGDGQGGSVVAWLDTTTSSVNVLYAQRYSADGSTPWGSPVLVSSASTTPNLSQGYLRTFRLVPTTDGNVALVWSATPSGLYAEKIDMANGAKLWGPLSGGILVSTVTSPQWTDVIFAEDDSSYIAYQDSQTRIYLKHVRSDGTLGPASGPTVDAGIDAGIDAGADAGDDAGVPDAGPDAGADAGPDAGNVGTDAGVDAGIADAGPDAGTSGGGCSTSSSSGGAAIWAVMVAVLGLAAVRRRSARVREE